MRYIFLIHIIFFFFTSDLAAQDSDSLRTDTTNVSVIADTIKTEMPDSLKNGTEEKEEFFIWKQGAPVSSRQVLQDSLLRWQVWPDWGHYYAYRRDAVSFRQASTGRIDAYHIRGYLPEEQEYSMEGISLNNPITGLMNFNLVPHRKIASVHERYEGSLRSEFRLKDYYVIKPVSYLNYDESKFNYRNLEFMVSQNFTERTNLELSYWDRRDGDYYPSDEVQGSQVFAKLYHHLNDRYRLKTIYLRNQFNNSEPFGYVVNDPLNFSFSQFGSNPVFSNGDSEFTRWDLVSGIYRRKSPESPEQAGVELNVSRLKKDVNGISDNYKQDLLSTGGRGFLNIRTGPLNWESEISGTVHNVKDSSSVDISSWLDMQAESRARLRISKRFQISAGGTAGVRSDGFNGHEVFGGLNADLLPWLNWNIRGSVFSRMPDIQKLYWRSLTFTGNDALENEEGTSIESSLTLNEDGALSFGVSGRVRLMNNPILLRTDSSFSNAPEMMHSSATVFGSFTNHRWEFESSATYQMVSYENETDPVYQLDRLDDILWVRNNAFVKGYVFDRAAYLKFGLRSLFSPFSYSSRTFNTALEYWQGSSTYQELPYYFRVDAELSARIRAIMLVMRWENALDGVGQVGYFESAGFPMPPRRLIIGIRAQFRN